MRLLKVGQVAKKFGVTTQAIRNWTQSGLLPVAINTASGRHRLYDSDVVEALKAKIKNGELHLPRRSPPIKNAYPILTAFIQEIVALSETG